MTRPERWLDKYDLARRFGLIDGDGEPRVSGINRKAASGEWPSHLVQGELRFSPQDVAVIEEKLRHPATKARPVPAPAPPRASRASSQRSAKTERSRGGFADLEDRPIRDRRRAAS